MNKELPDHWKEHMLFLFPSTRFSDGPYVAIAKAGELVLYDFLPYINEKIVVTYEDESFSEFRCAFVKELGSEFVVFTEHCGYHLYNKNHGITWKSKQIKRFDYSYKYTCEFPKWINLRLKIDWKIF